MKYKSVEDGQENLYLELFVKGHLFVRLLLDLSPIESRRTSPRRFIFLHYLIIPL